MATKVLSRWVRDSFTPRIYDTAAVTMVSHLEDDAWESGPMRWQPPSPVRREEIRPGVIVRVYKGELRDLPISYRYLSDTIILDDGTIYKDRYGR